MGNGANVKIIHTLEDLRAALVRFGVDAEDALRAMEQEIQRTNAFLIEAERRWRRETQWKKEEVRRAASALRRCQASGYRDQEGRYHPPDCRSQEQVLLKAKRELAEAQTKLRDVQRTMQQVKQSIDAYHRQARRLTLFLQDDIPKASALLACKLQILQAYVSISPPEAQSEFTTVPPASGRSTSRVATIADKHSIQNDVRSIPVDSIHIADLEHVKGPEDFHKVSYEEMVEGFRKLQTVVQPAVAKGLGVDYFHELDKKLSLDYQHGYQRIYEAFYGDSAIRLEKIGNRYHVINGAHRLWVARQLQIENIPARVIDIEQA